MMYIIMPWVTFLLTIVLWVLQYLGYSHEIGLFHQLWKDPFDKWTPWLNIYPIGLHSSQNKLVYDVTHRTRNPIFSHDILHLVIAFHKCVLIRLLFLQWMMLDILHLAKAYPHSNYMSRRMCHVSTTSIHDVTSPDI